MDRKLAVLLLVLPLVAGCLAPRTPGGEPGPDGPDTSAPAPETILAEDHDHRDPALHEGAWRFDLASWRPMAEPNETARIHALDVWDDHLFVDGGMSLDEVTTAGFSIVNISDPGDPTVVGQWEDPRYHGADRSIAVTSDGNWVFLAGEGPDEEPDSRGVFVVDVSDKTDPEMVDFFPFPESGVHTIDAGIIDGTVYAFALNWGVNVLRLDQGPDGPRLVQVGKYATPGAESIVGGSDASPQERGTEIVRTVYGHDVDFRMDEAGGRPLLYVAYAYQGMHILDLSVPSAPELVSRWSPGGAGAPWYVHSVQTAQIDGSRVTVVGSEVFENRHETTPAPIWILDTSDLADPQQVGRWTNPSQAGAHSLLLSTHFFRIMDGTLHLSHYHGGVWSIDISTPDARETPTATGYYMPTMTNGFRPAEGCCGNWNLAGIPMTFDVEVHEGTGTVWAADWATGLYGLEPAAS